MLEFQAARSRRPRCSRARRRRSGARSRCQANAGRLAGAARPRPTRCSTRTKTPRWRACGAGLQAGRGAGGASTRVRRPTRRPGAALKAQLEDLALSLRDYRDGAPVTPGRLDEIESRLALIERLKKKYGATRRRGPRLRRALPRELEELGDPEEQERALASARRRAPGVPAAAARLSRERRRRPRRAREARRRRELTQLAMEKTRFQVRFDAGPAAGGRRRRRAGPSEGSSGRSSCCRPTRARSCGRSPASRRAASCRASCSRSNRWPASTRRA